jgi:phosphate butyryltransferase
MNPLAENKPIHTSDEIIEAAMLLSKVGRKKIVAVAGASDTAVLAAISSAHSDGILDAVLFGEEDKVKKAADDGGIDISTLKIMHYNDPAIATYHAVEMAAEGDADIIMKGFVSTSMLLKAVLSRNFNLRTNNLVSHTAALDIPGYHKLLLMTDGGMVVKPDIEQKIQILENSVLVARALRLKPVRVALSAAYDNVYDDVPQTIECRTIIEKVMDKKLDNVIIDGPMTFDSAVSKKAAEIKGLNSAVAGEADIYLVNSIEECNIIAKSLIGFADTIFAGVITGARVPISLVSRTDTMKNKKASVSIACLVAEYYKKEVAPTRGAAQE